MAFGADRFGGAIFTQTEAVAAVAEIHGAYGDGRKVPEVIFPQKRRGGASAFCWERKISLPRPGLPLSFSVTN